MNDVDQPSRVGSYLPSAHPRGKSSPRTPSPPRRLRRQPRSLAVQRLADELVGNTYGRRGLCHGLSGGHIGAVCDALTTAGIDPAVWTGHQLVEALNADMRRTGSSWPDHITNPPAFLANRLRRLNAAHDDSRATPASTAPPTAMSGLDHGLNGCMTKPLLDAVAPAGRPALSAAQHARIRAARAYIDAVLSRRSRGAARLPADAARAAPLRVP